MKAVFADTSFFIEILNSSDEAHEKAVDFLTGAQMPILTTEWVLVELGNFLCAPPNRRLYRSFVNDLRKNNQFNVLSTQFVPFEEGFALYCNRPDKSWSMVDCLSFFAMKARKLTSVLTTDHHFEQAGFENLIN